VHVYVRVFVTTGVMGLATAKALQALGYRVSGWSRSQPDAQQQQQRSGMTSYVGQQQLHEFVSQQDVVVCLLPLTAQTTGGWVEVGGGL
jgi:glyoxylate/hydroxypyruvate reductase A